MFWPGDENSFFSQPTVGQAITSPPGRVGGTFSCHLRNHPHYLVRDRPIITDEGGLDDRAGRSSLGEFLLGRSASCNGSPWWPHYNRQQN